jgi:hypothetical protein
MISRSPPFYFDQLYHERHFTDFRQQDIDHQVEWAGGHREKEGRIRRVVAIRYNIGIEPHRKGSGLDAQAPPEMDSFWVA